MAKNPKGAGEHAGDAEPPPKAHPYSFLDQFKKQTDDKAPQNPEWQRHKEEFQADPRKLKAFLDRCAEAVAGPRRDRKDPVNPALLAEFAFHFGVSSDADPAALRAALELGEVWRMREPLKFARLYLATDPNRARELWGAVRARGTRGQIQALPWRVLRPLQGLRWIPVPRLDGTVARPPFSHTIEDLPTLKKHFEAMRDGVRQALEAHKSIRELQRGRVKRHEEALAELDAMADSLEGQWTKEWAEDFDARRRAAEARLLDADIDERHPMQQLWSDGDIIQDGYLLRDVAARLVGLATRLDQHCALVEELAEGSQPRELQRGARNLNHLSRVAGELVLAIGGAWPDRRRGARGPEKPGAYRLRVQERARDIIRIVYGQEFSFQDLRTRAQKAAARK